MAVFGVDTELDSSGDHDDLCRGNPQFAKFSCYQHDTPLRNNQKVPISRIHGNFIRMHICLERESAYAESIFHLGTASSHHGLDLLMEHTSLSLLWWPTKLLRGNFKPFISIKV